jgi:hypothetical protein
LNVAGAAVGMMTNALDASSCAIELHIAMAFALGCAGWTIKRTMCVATATCLLLLVASWFCLWHFNQSWPSVMSLSLGCVIFAYMYGSYALREAPRQLRHQLLRRAFSYVLNFSLTILPLVIVRYAGLRSSNQPRPLSDMTDAFTLCASIARVIYGLNGFCNACVYFFWWYCSRRAQRERAEGLATQSTPVLSKSFEPRCLSVLEHQVMFDFFDLDEDGDSSEARRLVAAAVAEARELRKMHESDHSSERSRV